MTTTAEAVERHLETDVALVDLLSRQIANLRASARWLIEEHGWDASEEAVVSALRRYIQEHPEAPLSGDRELLAESLVDVHTGLALLTLPRTRPTHERMPEVWRSIDPPDTLAVSLSRKRVRLLVEQDDVVRVEESLGTLEVEDEQAPVSAIRLTLPEAPSAIALVAHALAMLVHRGTRVDEVLTCLPEAWIVVDADSTMEAFERVARLTEPRPTG